MLLKKLLPALMLCLSAVAVQGRRVLYTIYYPDYILANESGVGAKQAANGNFQDCQQQDYAGEKGHQSERGIAMHSLAKCLNGKQATVAYDITRESGSSFFDTVYKLRVPATKHLQLGLNCGYTFYDRYTHGFSKAGSLGVEGGISFTMLHSGRNVPGGKSRKGFFRLNADLVSYPYRKSAASDAQRSLLDKYMAELSARIYVDAKIGWRMGRGAIITRCLAGFGAGAEQQAGRMALFIGAGVAYRLR